MTFIVRLQLNQSKKKRNLDNKWSELCPDLLRCVFKRLSFTDFNRAKLVCSSWHSASKHCVPQRNQIPWLVLFPRKKEEATNNNNNNNNNSRCVLLVPEDKNKVYTTRDLGVNFVESHCLSTFGSWVLMLNPVQDLYILNPLTGERIELPNTKQFRRVPAQLKGACFWIDNKTQDYLVIMRQSSGSVFTKKGDNKWHDFLIFSWYRYFVYNHKDQKVYIDEGNIISIWGLSGDYLRNDGYLDPFTSSDYDFSSWFNHEIHWGNLIDLRTRVSITVSGDVLIVASIVTYYKIWHFRIYKYEPNHKEHKWVKIDSLGDEALIYDMSVTGIAGIKRNSYLFQWLPLWH